MERTGFLYRTVEVGGGERDFVGFADYHLFPAPSSRKRKIRSRFAVRLIVCRRWHYDGNYVIHFAHLKRLFWHFPSSFSSSYRRRVLAASSAAPSSIFAMSIKVKMSRIRAFAEWFCWDAWIWNKKHNERATYIVSSVHSSSLERAFHVILECFLSSLLILISISFVCYLNETFLHDINNGKSCFFVGFSRGSSSPVSGESIQVKSCRFYLRACVMEINIPTVGFRGRRKTQNNKILNYPKKRKQMTRMKRRF